MSLLLGPGLLGLAVLLAAFTLVWLLSLALRDASIVDPFWGPAILLAAIVYRLCGPPASSRQLWALALLTIWALRLGGYLWWRGRGEPEDRRYREIRARHRPGFAGKSLFIVFWLQAGLAWVIAAPQLALQAQTVPALWRWSDLAGGALWLAGFVFECVGDAQLARFKADQDNAYAVLDTGLWRYTRHPNYFGELCMAWGLWLVALAAPGTLWAAIGPLLLTVLLVRVSGVALTEKDIADRRPAYRRYLATTPALVPGRPKPEVVG